MTEHDALVERMVDALMAAPLSETKYNRRQAEIALDAILDGNTLIVGTRIGDGLVRLSRAMDAEAAVNRFLLPITDTDPARG